MKLQPYAKRLAMESHEWVQRSNPDENCLPSTLLPLFFSISCVLFEVIGFTRHQQAYDEAEQP